MSAVSSDRLPDRGLAAGAPGSYDHRALARRGARAGVVAMVAAIGWLMFCGETAAAPTTVAGIRSSTWTPVTSVTAIVFGTDAFHGSFHVLSILFGLGALLVLGAALGVLGAFAIAETVGVEAGPVGAVAVGLFYAAFLQVVLINLLANLLEGPDLLYHSIPAWGWLVGSATYGVVLALRLARLNRLARERDAA